MRKQFRWIPDASEAFRPVAICIVAVVLAAAAMSLAGSPVTLAVMAASAAVLATATVLQLSRGVTHWVHRSMTAGRLFWRRMGAETLSGCANWCREPMLSSRPATRVSSFPLCCPPTSTW